MKDSKSITLVKRRNIMIFVVIATVIVGLLATWFYFNKYSKIYNAPSFEKAYGEGKVEIDEKYGYSEMQIAEEYAMGACGNPYATAEGIDLYLSNPEKNDVLLKCILLDDQGNRVGESGLIKPNTYVKNVKFDEPMESGFHNLIVKVLGFEPETYYSKGVVHLRIGINIE